MIEIYIFAAVVLIATGLAFGVVAIASSGIRQEERNSSLLTHTTDRVTCGARRLNGVYTRP
jgi:hypothetical protein